MKIMLINFSGNVGKTTIAVNLLKPRMPDDTPFFSIETINSGADADGVANVEVMKGKNFGELREELMLLDDAIIDVGASNVEQFLKLMQQFEGSHEEIDLFLVPVTAQSKVQQDTINTLKALALLGIKSNKIQVVFNRVELDDNPQAEFAAIFGWSHQTGGFISNPDAVIFSNEVYEGLKSIRKTLGDITSDNTDYRGMIKATDNKDEKIRLAYLHGLKLLSKTANKNLDAVFKVLTCE